MQLASYLKQCKEAKVMKDAKVRRFSIYTTVHINTHRLRRQQNVGRSYLSSQYLFTIVYSYCSHESRRMFPVRSVPSHPIPPDSTNSEKTRLGRHTLASTWSELAEHDTEPMAAPLKSATAVMRLCLITNTLLAAFTR